MPLGRRRFLLWCGSGARDDVSGVKKKGLSEEEFEKNIKILRSLMSVLEKKHLKRDGLFRVPGNAEAINDANGLLERGEDPDLVVASVDADEGADALASLLKKWTGKLKIIKAPEELVEFLAKVADESESNRMPARNLATVFGPIFAPPPTPQQPYDEYVREVLSPTIEELAKAIQDAQERHFDAAHQNHIHLRDSPAITNGKISMNTRPLATTKTHTIPSRDADLNHPLDTEKPPSDMVPTPDTFREDGGSLYDEEEDDHLPRSDERPTIEVAIQQSQEDHDLYPEEQRQEEQESCYNTTSYNDTPPPHPSSITYSEEHESPPETDP
mmetsp:Transcript_4486/g.6369  ORF Transcript_4486/g.6369 Transcript_4486/m.6369 type:complete len:328 (-) Transcript_4486:689-1672(-)|eukprot:CAMPEP_0197289460 /NCGR_PEP_ID=MMETSP0890-20130614/6733_1 /TAXON_ID=44058 ORGANISM="Aureoumbra lagunensis, Strain CCMP1510" /NCGR_SAMPLE_ID=MMETSP0890 /ASSEMBLY_ACC=CAM_ASM_000533 /LENGTH=327 /DNA_ID=CAMNT_0042760905 /DNA_START=99 /DNA_END=1082 /DNA_ORIENTATION=+